MRSKDEKQKMVLKKGKRREKEIYSRIKGREKEIDNRNGLKE